MEKETKEKLEYYGREIGKLLKAESKGLDKKLYEGEKFLRDKLIEIVNPEIGEIFFSKMGELEEK
jgi:hypothetical protein